LLKENALEYEKRNKATEKQFRDTDKRIKELANLFTGQWGKLMEALIEPSCLKLFKDRGLEIERSMTNIKIERADDETEFDIVLLNGVDIVIVEVKTTVTDKEVNHFLKKLSRIHSYFPEYHDKNIFGCIAGIKYASDSAKHAYRKGLFVLKNTGENIIKIANGLGFKPRKF